MFRALLIAICILGMHAAQAADVKLDGDFVGPGIYSPTTGCKKLEAIEKGDAAPNIATYPLRLTSEGTRGWEGGCDFTAIRKVKPDTFEAVMRCSEGADNFDETITFRRLDANRIEVSSGGEALIYERCKALKGN